MYGLGMVKGMALTLKHLLRKPITIQYPEERAQVAPRFRGYEFAWYEDRCTVCATCAKACPHGVIRIVSAPTGNGRYRAEVFEIDTALCFFCGLCAEACPYAALFMGTQFERGNYSRARLVLQKEDLNAQPKRPSAYDSRMRVTEGARTEEARAIPRKASYG